MYSIIFLYHFLSPRNKDDKTLRILYIQNRPTTNYLPSFVLSKVNLSPQ